MLSKITGLAKFQLNFTGLAVSFLSGSVCLAVSFFSQMHFKVSIRSRNLNIQKVSVSQRKTLVSLSRKVSNLPFATPVQLTVLAFLCRTLCCVLYDIINSRKKVSFEIFGGIKFQKEHIFSHEKEPNQGTTCKFCYIALYNIIYTLLLDILLLKII